MSTDAPTSRPAGFASTVLAILLIGFFYWSEANDTCGAQALVVARSSPELVARLGVVRDVSLRRRVWVQDATSVSNQFVAGYRLYEVRVKGSTASALVTLETGLKTCSPNITEID